MFVAYALHCTRLQSSVTFAALYLLQHLNQRIPAAEVCELASRSVRTSPGPDGHAKASTSSSDPYYGHE
jgi:hypothetical protein